jgi:hypothetical protein
MQREINVFKAARPECPFYHSIEERRNTKDMKSQIPKRNNVTQSPPIYKDKPAMKYYPPPPLYQQVQHHCYSPPAALQYYPQCQSPFKPVDTKPKPKSKLSTKSPHAITGHKLTRKNTGKEE